MQAYSPRQVEFLITGEIDYQENQIERDGWSYFHTEGDEFSYSVVQNLLKAGFNAELIVINNSQ